MTVLDMKKLIFSKVKYVFNKTSSIHDSDEELNKHLLLHIVDNLPF